MQNLVVAGILFITMQVVGRSPEFVDYPVSRAEHGRSVQPILNTAFKRRFRSRITNAARQRSNFAGQYVIAEWGCGSSCVQMALVDKETGEVVDSPFGPTVLTYGQALDFGCEKNEVCGGYSFERNSSLLVAKGCPNENGTQCGQYWFEWTGRVFRQLRFRRATPFAPLEK